MSERVLEFPTEQVHQIQIATLQRVTEADASQLEVLMNCLSAPGSEEQLSRSWLEAIALNPQSDIVIARERSEIPRIVGTLTLNAVLEPTQRGSYAHIGGVVVHPEARGQRLTSRLLNFAEGWAEARGLHTLRLFTETSKTPAIRAYQSWGASVEEHNSQGERRLFYVKRLGE